MTKTTGNKTLVPKRGDVFWVNFDPTQGTETKKMRPAVVLSNNLFSKYLPRLIVAPITSSLDKKFEFDAIVIVSDRRGKAMLDQIRTIDKSRLGKKIGALTMEEMSAIDQALRVVLALS